MDKETAVEGTHQCHDCGHQWHDNDDDPDRRRNLIEQPHTDLGNTRRMVADHGHDLRYAPQWGTWLTWDGARWAEDITGEAHRRAKAVVDGMLTQMATLDDGEARKQLHKWWQRSQAASRIDAMVHLAKSEPGIPVTISEMDADPWAINTKSGLVNLHTGTITATERRHLVTKMAPVTISAEATCPTWEWFVEWAMCGNKELVDFLRRAVGYSLTGTVGEQVLFFLHGGGANGKSTFLTVLQRMLGDYAAAAEPDLLLSTQGDRHPAGIADLLGRRLVVVQETDEGRRLAEATVKVLTGGDTIKARRMRENFFEFRPTHKLWMAANHRPRVRGTDHAIWRRIILIPFVATVAPDAQDRHLLDKLLDELPGIMQWALAGCRQWATEGLRPPAAVIDATRDYRVGEDHVGRFLDECCLLDEHLSVSAHHLRQTYEAWCAEAGERPWSAKAVAPHLADRGCTLDRTKSARVWRGITVAWHAGDTTRGGGDRGGGGRDASPDASPDQGPF